VNLQTNFWPQPPMYIFKVLYIESHQKCRELGVFDSRAEWESEFDGRKYLCKEAGFFSKYDLVIATNYSSSISNLICCKCKSVGVKTAFFSDGIYDLANSIRNPLLLGNRRVLYGYLPFDYFFAVNKVVLFSGHPQFFYYLPRRVVNMNSILELPESDKLLITTANSAYFDNAEYGSLIKLINQVIAYVSSKGMQFSIRIFDEKILGDLVLPDGVHNDVGDEYEECLRGYSHVITTPSTIALTSMYHGRATAQLIYRSEPASVSSAWNIPSIEAFDAAYESFRLRDGNLMSYQSASIAFSSDSISPEQAVETVLLQERELYDQYSQFRESEAERILNSSFNLNLEYWFRKFYERSIFRKYFVFLKSFIRQ